MKEVESSGARVILPLVAIVFVLIALWFVVTIREDRVTAPAEIREDVTEVIDTPAVDPPVVVDQSDATTAVDDPYAPNKVFTEITSDQFYQIMKGAGYNVEMDEDNDVRWRFDDGRALFLTYDGGHALQFYIWLTDTDVTLRDLNDWNQTKRFSRTYLDRDGDPVLELDLDLAGGVTVARILDWANTCEVSFKKWCRAMGQ